MTLANATTGGARKPPGPMEYIQPILLYYSESINPSITITCVTNLSVKTVVTGVKTTGKCNAVTLVWKTAAQKCIKWVLIPIFSHILTCCGTLNFPWAASLRD